MSLSPSSLKTLPATASTGLTSNAIDSFRLCCQQWSFRRNEGTELGVGLGLEHRAIDMDIVSLARPQQRAANVAAVW